MKNPFRNWFFEETPRTTKLVLAAFLMGSVVLGLLLPRVLPSFPIVSDSLDYQVIADTLVTQHTYSAISAEQILYPPGYPIFLAFFFWLQGHIGYTAVYFAQMLLVGCTAWLIYLLTKKQGVRPIFALAAGISTLFWPYLLLYAHLVASEIPYITLLVASVTGLVYALKQPSEKKRALLPGLLFGLAILTRPVALLLPLGLLLAFGAWMLLRWLPVQKELMRLLARVFLMAMLVVTPWTIAVSLHTGTFTPVASNLSFVLKKANTSLAYLPEHAAQETHEASPSEFIRAKLRNVVLFWNPGAGGDNMELLAERHPFARALILVYKIGYFLLLGLAALGIWYRRKDPRSLALFVTILYFWAVHTVLFPFPRYTLPLLPFVIALAAIGANELYSRKRQTETALTTHHT